MTNLLGLLDRIPKLTADDVTMGDLARDQRDWAEAERSYRMALEKHPDMSHIWVQFGHALKEQGKIKEALVAYLEAVERNQRSADAALQLGHAYKLDGSIGSAQAEYMRALDLDPTNENARKELLCLGWSEQATHQQTNISNDAITVALELTDLVDHLQHATYLTGIQRVQWALARALALEAPDAIIYIYYVRERNFWVQIRFDELRLLLEGGRGGLLSPKALKLELAHNLVDTLRKRSKVRFPRNSRLLNPGTSWGFMNYFSSIRQARREAGVLYIPYVHDCIPVLFPNFCDPNLVKDYLNWALDLFAHADLIVANSENTKHDVQGLAIQMGEDCPDIAVAYLDGAFANEHTKDEVESDPEFLTKHGLTREPFVLMVSTVEPRKNHILALAAWTELLKGPEPTKIPLLVFAGAAGWDNAQVYSAIERDPRLKRHVVVLINVSDEELSLLYQNCLFTIYPSLYEGWGLPVSESLSYGKLPVVSNTSSLPEAGGDLAIYFDPTSFRQLTDIVISLIFNRETLRLHEYAIRSKLRLRDWAEIARDLLEKAKSIPTLNESKQYETSLIQLNRHYSFGRNASSDINGLQLSGDRFRSGLNWYSPESWGCWTKRGGGDLSFKVPIPGDKLANEQLTIFVNIVSPPNIDLCLYVSSPGLRRNVDILQPRARSGWHRLELTQNASGEVRISLACRDIDDFSIATDGQDTRAVEVGLAGIYACLKSDMAARLAFSEAIAFNGLTSLSSLNPN